MIQKRASLHEQTVQKVAKGEHLSPKGRRKAKRRGDRTSNVRVTSLHPALVMAHALGIPAEHVQITGEAPNWGCIIWNYPAPWPGSTNVHSVNDPTEGAA